MIVDPSRDQAGADTGQRLPGIACDVSVFDARSWIHRSIWPPRSLTNAICVLSGDHAGSRSTAASLVIRTGTRPKVITHRSPSAVNATMRPFGDTTGVTIPLRACGSVDSSG